jgi:small-conductance mechanosensitive channel
MGEALKRMAVGAVAAAIAVGLLGAVIGWASSRVTINTAIAGTYYVVGAILFLLGMFPTGGFSMIRGTITRRRPTGSRQEPVFLLGVVLIVLGILVDLINPF